jgi:hypothetical protein
VDSKNIPEMVESLARFKERNFVLCEENLHLNFRCGELQYQIDNMQACHSGMESEMDFSTSKEKTSCAPCSGWETAGGGNYLSDNNLSLFSSSDNNGSNFL